MSLNTKEQQVSPRSVTISPAYLFLLFLGVSVLLSLGNWALPLIDRDEPRFAEASREMRQTGDLIIPRLNGEDRLDKPPLIYWLQAGAFSVFGESDFTARLPSVLFAAASCVVTAVWAARLYNPRVGLRAAVLFGTCLQVFVHGRAAVADMPMIFFFLLATWIGWERLHQPASKLLWLGFYLALAFGFLAKGPVAFLPALFPPLLALLMRAPFRPGLFRSVGGLLLVLVVIGLWGVPALILTHGQYFEVGIGKHVVMRSLEPMESHGLPGPLGYLASLPFYFISVFGSFLPWSGLLPAAVIFLYKSPDSKEKYLLVGISVVIATFTILQTKLPHYILPSFPLLAIAMAHRAGTARWLAPTCAVAILFYLTIALVAFPMIAPFFASKSIVNAVQSNLGPKTRTGSLGYDEQSLIWYFRFTTRRFHERTTDVEAFLNRPGSAICVVDASRRTADLPFPSAQVSGYNFARWHLRPGTILGISLVWPQPVPVDLVAYIKQ
jgi:4-amino-4-deoxy-L-arabinose transferase-like glycosyltransferase